MAPAVALPLLRSGVPKADTLVHVMSGITLVAIASGLTLVSLGLVRWGNHRDSCLIRWWQAFLPLLESS